MYSYSELTPVAKRSHKIRNVIIGVVVFLVLSFCVGLYNADRNKDTFTVVSVNNYKSSDVQRNYASRFIRDAKGNIKGIIFTEVE